MTDEPPVSTPRKPHRGPLSAMEKLTQARDQALGDVAKRQEREERAHAEYLRLREGREKAEKELARIERALSDPDEVSRELPMPVPTEYAREYRPEAPE
jgi:hypothetical protein